MKITVIGTGYVGLVTGACLADVGNDVLCLDIDAEKIRVLNDGGIPIFEPGLPEMVRRNVAADRIRFTTDVAAAVAHGMIQFIAVGTPPDEDGSADLQYVLAAARNIGRLMDDYKLVVDKSTVPVGTADKVSAALADELEQRGADLPFSVVSNPEFLKQGAAVEDFMRPDRIVYAANPMAALAGADALIIVTEWKEFRSPDFDAVKVALKSPVIFDGRNLYPPEQPLAAGLDYYPIGRRQMTAPPREG